MVRITLIDGSQQEIPREKARQVLPVPQLLRSPALKAGIAAVFCHQGKLVPVYGPMGKITDTDWLLLLDEGACLIRGLPAFVEDQKLSLAPVVATPEDSDSDLEAELAEIEDLLKSA